MVAGWKKEKRGTEKSGETKYRGPFQCGQHSDGECDLV